MANRYLRRKWAYDVESVDIDGKFTVGAAGAVGTVTARGVATVVRTGSGAYTITLSDVFRQITSISGCIVQAVITDLDFKVLSYSASAKTISIVTEAAGAPTDPASGNEVHFRIVAKNSSVNA